MGMPTRNILNLVRSRYQWSDPVMTFQALPSTYISNTFFLLEISSILRSLRSPFLCYLGAISGLVSVLSQAFYVRHKFYCVLYVLFHAYQMSFGVKMTTIALISRFYTMIEFSHSQRGYPASTFKQFNVLYLL